MATEHGRREKFEREMQDFREFVTTGKYPPTCDTPSEKRKLRNMRSRLRLVGGVIWTAEGKEVIADEKQQQEVLKELHEGVSTGGTHLGRDKTARKVCSRYYWKGVWDDCLAYVKSCHKCQNYNRIKKSTAPQPLNSIPVSQTWKQVGVDLIGPLKETKNGNNYIITLCDFFSKWPEAAAIPDKSADSVAKFLKSVMTRMGYVEVLVTDQGKEFVNSLNSQLFNKWGIEHRLASCHPTQSNGLVKRFSRTLQTALLKVTNSDGDDWDEHLEDLLFGYRTSVHSSTGHTPFRVMYGREAKLPVDFRHSEENFESREEVQNIAQDENEATLLMDPSTASSFEHFDESISAEAMENLNSTIEEIQRQVKRNILKAKARQQMNYNKRIKLTKNVHLFATSGLQIPSQAEEPADDT